MHHKIWRKISENFSRKILAWARKSKQQGQSLSPLLGFSIRIILPFLMKGTAV